MTTRSGRILVGTSGWSYDHWDDAFYPDGLENEEQLAFCAERFSSVEINNSFYHLPEARQLKAWRDAVPSDFVFAVKASRYITHMKKLKDAHQSVSRFMDRLEPLEDKLGPVLFQLPPNWRFDHDRLKTFLQGLNAYCYFDNDQNGYAAHDATRLQQMLSD